MYDKQLASAGTAAFTLKLPPPEATETTELLPPPQPLPPLLPHIQFWKIGLEKPRYLRRSQ